MHCNKKIVFVPLTPRQVYEDQVKLQRESEIENERKNKEKVERKK